MSEKVEGDARKRASVDIAWKETTFTPVGMKVYPIPGQYLLSRFNRLEATVDKILAILERMEIK